MLISVLICILLMVLLIIDYLIHRNLCTPVVIFTGIWLVILSAGSLRLFGFSGYSDKTAVLIALGVFSFALGTYAIEGIMDRSCKMNRNNVPSMVSNGNRQFERENFSVVERSEISLNMLFLYVILGFSCIGYFISALSSIRAMLSGVSIAEIRENLMGYASNYDIVNPVVDSYFTFFCSPAMTILLPIAIIFLFQKKHRIFVGIVALCFLLGIIARGGRMGIFDVILMCLVCLRFFHHTLPRRTKRMLITLVLCGVTAMIAVTLARGKTQVFLNVYTYFTIGAPMFERYSQAFVQADFISYGGATFYPFMYVLNMLFNLFGESNEYLEQLVYFVGYPQDTWISGLFPQGVLNAFCSEFYYFYMDFRLFGIVLFSFIHGLVCSYFYVQSFKRCNVTMLIWYLLIVHGMFFSFVIWQLGNSKFFVSAVILLVAQLTTNADRNIRKNVLQVV